MKYKNPTESFELLFKEIKENGEDFANTKALFNVSFTIEDPTEKVITTPQRKFKKDYAEYEWQWYLKGNRDAKEIAERAKIWKNMMVPFTTEVNSNYGFFWKYNDQYKRVIEELKQNPNTRRAVILHYGIHELDRYEYDTPCNVVLNLYRKDDLLHLTVFARSIDLVFGYCNDQYTFAKFMEKASEDLGGVGLGSMHWFVTNLHLYPRHYDLMER